MRKVRLPAWLFYSSSPFISLQGSALKELWRVSDSNFKIVIGVKRRYIHTQIIQCESGDSRSLLQGGAMEAGLICKNISRSSFGFRDLVLMHHASAFQNVANRLICRAQVLKNDAQVLIYHSLVLKNGALVLIYHFWVLKNGVPVLIYHF